MASGLTWNMQHGGDRWITLEGTGRASLFDFICLQEMDVRSFPGGWAGGATAGGTIHFGTRSRGVAYNYFVQHFGLTGMNSLAVLSPHLIINTHSVMPPWVSTRPSPGIEVNLPGYGLAWVFSIHAPSLGGSPAQLGWIDTVLTSIQTHSGGNFICAGDFNASPAAIASMGWSVVSSGEVTQRSGGELDFAVCSAGLVTIARADTAFSTSDHVSVRFS